MKRPELQTGRALVLVGPEGSGKTELAREIARAFGGAFVEVEHRDLLFLPTWRDIMGHSPSTVIVDGLPLLTADDPMTATLKAAISGAWVPTFQSDRRPRLDGAWRAPQFIFCTGAVDWLPGPSDRRFHVVPMSEVHS